jgi:YggT family protein
MDQAVAYGLAQVLNFLFNALSILIIMSAAISWLDASPSNPIVRAVHTMTEPLFALVRPWTRKIPGPLDLAPLAIILIVMFLQRTITFWLMSYAKDRI